MLRSEHVLAKIGFDTAKNEHCEVCPFSVNGCFSKDPQVGNLPRSLSEMKCKKKSRSCFSNVRETFHPEIARIQLGRGLIVQMKCIIR